MNDLENHFLGCGNRLSGEESERILGLVTAKYARNPMKSEADAELRRERMRKLRRWATKGLYRQTGQLILEEVVKLGG